MNPAIIQGINCLAILDMIIIVILCLRQKTIRSGLRETVSFAAAVSIFLGADNVFVRFLGQTGSTALVILYISKTVYLMMNTVIVFLWSEFVGKVVWTEEYPLRKRSKQYRLILAVNLLAAAINPFTGIIFKIIDGQFVATTWGMIIFTVLNYFMAGRPVLTIFTHKSGIKSENFLPLVLFPFLPFVAEIVKLIWHDVDIIALYSVTAIILLYVLQNSYIMADEMTGLANRARLKGLLGRWLASKYNYLVFGIMIDIDGLKQVNDTFGHLAGDQMIIRTAEMFKRLPKHVTSIRYGGDEFIAIWRGHDPEEVNTIRKALLTAQQEINMDLPVPERIHFAMGSYYCSTPGDTEIDDFLRCVDGRLYERKQELDLVIEDAMSETNSIAQFEVFYQPAWSIKNKCFEGGEALLRLKHEKYGYISPSTFIPVAEKSSAILEIGDMVLRNVCEFINSDQYNALGFKHVGVNLSAVQLMDNDLVTRITRILDKAGVPHETVVFEITETALTNSDEVFSANMDALVKAGFDLALDDFGSGYSNSFRLSNAPFAMIKLDKALVDGYKTRIGRVVLKNMINMVHELGIPALAEGVETEEQASALVELGCEYVQGFFYARPMCVHTLVEKYGK